MTIFATVLICLLLTGRCTAKSANELEHSDSDDKIKARFSRGRVLEQTASGNVVAQEVKTEEIDCYEVKIGADLDLEGGRVLRNLTTTTISECCEACQELETCTIFRRNRSNGACELIDAPESGFGLNPYSDHDVGGHFAFEFAYSYDAPSVPVPVPPCPINEGRAYPNGLVLERRNAPSSQHCCAVCQGSTDCYSWHFNNRNNRCTLNRNIPSATNSSNFSGGAFN